MPMIWKPIPEWEGWYEVGYNEESGDAEVRSLDRERVDARGHRRKYPSKTLSPTLRDSGALVYKLHRDGKPTKIHEDKLLFDLFEVERWIGSSNQYVQMPKSEVTT